MKARPVKRLDPDGPLADNVERIVRVRCEELHSFAPAALDPAEVDALHDMRIAAKRLRYILELHSPSFGPYAAEAAKVAKRLQEVIGEIHDCDVTIPRVDAMIARCREEDREELLARTADGATDVSPADAAGLPHAAHHRGLEALRAHLAARRAHHFARFLVLWRELGRDGFRARLEYALGERPDGFTSASHPEAGERLPSPGR